MIEQPPPQNSNPIVEGFRRLWEIASTMISKRDYGQLLIFMAVLVGLPRWVGAMLAADGIRVYSESSGFFSAVYWLLVSMYGLSSFGMALLEVFSVGYIFDALRVLKPTYPSGKTNIRWWGCLLFGIVLLIMMPVILGPYMLSQLHDTKLIDFLKEWDAAWIVTVILAPTAIIAGISFARDGLVTELKKDQPKPTNTPAPRQVPPQDQPAPSPAPSPDEAPEPEEEQEPDAPQNDNRKPGPKPKKTEQEKAQAKRDRARARREKARQENQP